MLSDCEANGSTIVEVNTDIYTDLMDQLSLSNITPTEIGPALESYFGSLDESYGVKTLEQFYKTGGFVIGKWEL